MKIILVTVCLFLSLSSYLAVIGGTTEIRILPNRNHSYLQLGKSHLLTCVIYAENLTHLTNFKWLDPRNVNIDGNYTKTNPRIRVKVRDDSSNQLQLVIDKLYSDDGGTYTCVVDYRSESLVASVFVDPYRTITFVNAPPNQWTLLKWDYKIKCQVEATQPLDIAWRRKNVSLLTNDKYRVDVDGLVVRNASLEDEGEYDCVATTPDLGEQGHRTIYLEITEPVRISNVPSKPIDVIEGENATLKCEASGRPKPKIGWKETSTAVVVSNNTTDGVYYIEKVHSDESNYTCFAKNDFAAAEGVFALNVQSKPKIRDVFSSAIKNRPTGSVQCEVYAKPEPRITLVKLVGNNTETISNDESRRITNPKNPRVFSRKWIIPNNNSSIEGMYECHAVNTVGQTQKDFDFIISYPPIIHPSKNTNTTYGWTNKIVHLTCLVDAYPTATVRWYCNNTLINGNGSVYRIFANDTASTLQVKPEGRRQRYGEYLCEAENIIGLNAFRIWFLEAFPPAAVKSFEVYNATATSVSFQITETPDERLPVKEYVAQYILTAATDKWDIAKNETWPRDVRYTVLNLAPDTDYTFRVAAINDAGVGRWSLSKTQRTLPRSPPNEPIIISNGIVDGNDSNFREDFILELNTSTDFELRWNIPSDNGIDIDHYKLQYCVAVNDSRAGSLEPVATTCVNKTLNIDKTNYNLLSSYLITDLIPDTYYEVKLRAHNNAGDGPNSKRYFKTNLRNEPVAGQQVLGLEIAGWHYVAIFSLTTVAIIIIETFRCFYYKNGVLYRIRRTYCDMEWRRNSNEKLFSSDKNKNNSSLSTTVDRIKNTNDTTNNISNNNKENKDIGKDDDKTVATVVYNPLYTKNFDYYVDRESTV